MELQSLTYTSVAADGLTLADVDAIHRAALTYNPLDGITGLLLFNGTSFLQMIEGAESALDDLVERLRRDPRHHSIELRDRRPIERRFMPDWTMHRLDVGPSRDEGIAGVEAAFAQRLDGSMMGMVGRSLSAISLPAAN